MAELIRGLRQLFAATGTASDADLLGRFVAGRDGSAFAALVERHGPMVLAVCRRVLRHRQDAEDAFQATFLVLARRAGAVEPRSLGNWLYGVAYRTAMGARRVARVRRDREAKTAVRAEDAAPDGNGLAADLRDALDRELDALPDVYRAAIVACDLEGLPRREAVARLGWSEGTLASRLARGRALLARRLSRYALAVPAAGLGVVAAPAVVAAELAAPTVRLGTLVAAGEAVASASVAALMEGAMRMIVLTKLKVLAAAAVVGCAVAVTAAAGWRADAAGIGDPPAPSDAPQRAAPNPDKERIAELERERERLLRQLAELKDRLEKVEAAQQRDAAAADEMARRAVAEEHAAKRAAEKARLAAEAEAERARLLERVEGLRRGREEAQANPAPAPKKAAVPEVVQAKKDAAEAAEQVRNYEEALRLAKQRAELLQAAAVEAERAARQAPKGTPEPKTPAPVAPAAIRPPATAVVKVYPVGELASDEKEGEALAKVLRAAVEPKSWGVDAGVEYLPARKALVVRQTDKGHEEVAEVLRLLLAQSPPPDKKPRPR